MSDFIGLDSDFFGDGSSDATTQPLSTFKENRLDDNTRYLIENGSRSSWQYRHRRSLATQDKVGSYYWTNRFLQRVTISPYDKRVRVYLNGSVEFDGAGDGLVNVRGYLLAGSSAGAGKITATTNVDWDGVGHSFFIDIYVDGAVKADTDCWVCVDVRSGKNGVKDNGRRIAIPEWSSKTPGYAFLYESGLGPVNGGQYIKIESSSDMPDGHDVLGVFPGKEKGEDWTVLYSPSTTAITPTSAEAVYAIDLSYLIQRGWSLEIYSDSDVASGQYTPHLAAEKRTQKTVLGQHVSKHGINMDHYWRRPRIVSMGPSRGSKFDNTSAYHSKWSLKKASSITQLLDASTFSTRLTACKVVIKGLMFGVHISDTPANAFKAKETDLEYIHQFDLKWPLYAKVNQPQDPAQKWSNLRDSLPGKLTVGDVNLRCFRAIQSFNRPLLRQIYHAVQGNVYTAVPAVIPGSEYLGGFNRTFHTGVLSEHGDDDDRALLTPFSIEVELDSAAGDYDPKEPLVVSLEAAYVNVGANSVAVLDGFNAQALDGDRIWLGLHSYNITVEPL